MTEHALREYESGDEGRVRELVESSMTTSYALSPREIDAILESDYLDETLLHPREDAFVVVAETDGTVVGAASATFGDDETAVQWIHVDPERRGAGVGTALFERISEEFDERGVEAKRAITLSANTNAGAFFERFGYGKVDERQREIGDEDLVEYVFEEGAETEESDADQASAGNESVPDYPDSVAGEDGEELYLGGEDDDIVPASEGYFVATYTESDRSERYGYYCLNCESPDVSMDSMETIRCNDCGNTRNPDEEYDGSYL
jgi:ribosomal protein S18 acetylase RimI-like enzyme